MSNICSFCGNKKRVRKLRFESTGIFQCLSCYTKQRRKTKKIGCSVCKRQIHAPHISKKDSSSICVNCYSRENKHCKVCGILGVFKYARCEKCHKNDLKPQKLCLDCGKKFNFKLDTTIRCSSCIQALLRKTAVQECAKCGKNRYICVKTTEIGGVCTYCYKKHFAPKRTCERCGNKRIAFLNKKMQMILCISCAEALRNQKN